MFTMPLPSPPITSRSLSMLLVKNFEPPSKLIVPFPVDSLPTVIKSFTDKAPPSLTSTVPLPDAPTTIPRVSTLALSMFNSPIAF